MYQTTVKQKSFQSLTHNLSSLIECTLCLPTLTFCGNCWQVFLHLVFSSIWAHFGCRMWNVRILITRHFPQNKFPGSSTKVCWNTWGFVTKWRDFITVLGENFLWLVERALWLVTTTILLVISPLVTQSTRSYLFKGQLCFSCYHCKCKVSVIRGPFECQLW